jgi:hypothetical protein
MEVTTPLGPLESVHLNHRLSEKRETHSIGLLRRYEFIQRASVKRVTSVLLGPLERSNFSHWTSKNWETPVLLGPEKARGRHIRLGPVERTDLYHWTS